MLLLSKSPGSIVARLFPDDHVHSMLVRADKRVEISLRRHDESRLIGPMARHSLRLLGYPLGGDKSAIGGARKPRRRTPARGRQQDRYLLLRHTPLGGPPGTPPRF